MAQQWEYIWIQHGGGNMKHLSAELNNLGAAGFELVGWASTDRTVGMNVWVAWLKRPGRKMAPPSDKADEQSWHPDPWGVHEHRMWATYYWSHIVSDAGEISEHVPGS